MHPVTGHVGRLLALFEGTFKKSQKATSEL